MMPMAFALGWGLLLATPLTVVLVPCLYMIGFDIRHFILQNRENPEGILNKSGRLFCMGIIA